uniref:Uncharacterized protein n=1 Tax=Neobodo designis TaxID=312471 RepID=A0A7S1QZJ0_NEODS|mmetsp:Transcript_55003/g.169482  ORF Transcript_55003/g.169482 Transcript_55003/m.169482 type:complete len:516 (+) Transcript_55003:728-2275(+)
MPGATPPSAVGTPANTMRHSLRQSQRGAASTVGGVTLSTVRYGLFAAGDPVRAETGRVVTFELYALNPKRKDCLGIVSDELRKHAGAPLAESIVWHPTEPRGPNPSSESFAALATRQVLIQHTPGEPAATTLATQLLRRTVAEAGAAAQTAAKKKPTATVVAPASAPPSGGPTSDASAPRPKPKPAPASTSKNALTGAAAAVAADPTVVSSASNAVRAAIQSDVPPAPSLTKGLVSPGASVALARSTAFQQRNHERSFAASMRRAGGGEAPFAASVSFAPGLNDAGAADIDDVAPGLEGVEQRAAHTGATPAAQALSAAFRAAWNVASGNVDDGASPPPISTTLAPGGRAGRRRSSVLLPTNPSTPADGLIAGRLTLDAPSGLTAEALPGPFSMRGGPTPRHAGGEGDPLDIDDDLLSAPTTSTRRRSMSRRRSSLFQRPPPTPSVPSATEVATAITTDGEARFRAWLSPFAPTGIEYIGVLRYADGGVAVRPHGGVVQHATEPVIFPVFVAKPH